ncbi:MAG: transposase [Candidatus Acidiferrales bacterium]
MAIPNRHGKLPGTYFVTSQAWNGHMLFQTAPNCEIFVETLLHYRDQGAYFLHGFVLMPNHFHLQLTPGSSVALERAIQFVKGGSAKKSASHKRANFRSGSAGLVTIGFATPQTFNCISRTSNETR